MIVSDLITEFDVVIDTSEGLTELRSLILGLAVRGKLVPQDPNDEPASKLLKKIEAEKERLYEEGAIRKPKDYPAVSEDEIPFEIPSNWVWARNGNLILFQNGYAFKSGRFQESGIGVIRIGDLQNGEVVENSMKYISEDYASEVKDDYLIKQGDMLIAMSGATTGKLAINNSDKTYLLNQRVGKIDPIFINQDYLYRYLNTKIEENLAKSSGSAIPNLSTKQIGELEIPLPPLSEQHRIVKRIESLFTEVDELEAKLTRQSKLDEKLQLAVNAEVQQAPDAEASKSSWNFITSNFDTLYHTPEAIDNLKKNILNEAVRGRLVPQNPNDESASELLKKIEAEKQRLYGEGKIRKPKKLPPVKEDEIPFEIPGSWEWCRFGDLASTVEYGTSQKAHKEPNGVPVLRMGNLDENGNMSFDNLKYVNEDIKDLPRLYLKNDDLVFNRTNSYELVGKMGLFKEREEKFTLASYLIRSTLLTDIYPEYIHYYFNSQYCRVNEIEPEITKQTNQANFNGTKLQHVRVPLPAKEEQHRIVKRIEELFALCDRFKAQLQQRQAVNERLVKGLVQEVLENN